MIEASNCIIDPVDDTRPGSLSVDFKVTDDPYAWQSAAASASAEKIVGIGDEAVWSPMGSPMGTIAVKNGDQAFIGMISVMGEDAGLKDKAVAFGRKAAEKM